MTGLILFALFLVVGVGMLTAGVYYLRKEKDDPESVKLYRLIATLGAAVAVVSVAVRAITG